ncbi:MAG: lipocalin family protein [Bacteroidota bacterium]
MKSNHYLIVVLMVGILSGSSSCSKDNPSCDTRVSSNKDSTSIVGTWELRSKYSGYSGNTEILPDCNGNRLVFTGNTYKRYTSGKLAREGTYRILKDTMRIKGKSEANRIILDTDTIVRNFLNNSGTELHIILDAFDGPESRYIRRND